MIRPASVKRFFKYSSIGMGTFLFDLLLLYFLIDGVGVHYSLAAAASFLLAVSANYALSRRYVFKGSERKQRDGYAFFIIIALVGMVCVTVGMVVLVEWWGVHYLLARVGVAVITGVWNYVMNLYINFDVAGKHV